MVLDWHRVFCFPPKRRQQNWRFLCDIPTWLTKYNSWECSSVSMFVQSLACLLRLQILLVAVLYVISFVIKGCPLWTVERNNVFLLWSLNSWHHGDSLWCLLNSHPWPGSQKLLFFFPLNAPSLSAFQVFVFNLKQIIFYMHILNGHVEYFIKIYNKDMILYKSVGSHDTLYLVNICNHF